MQLSQTRAVLLVAAAIGMLCAQRADAQVTYKVTDLGLGGGTSSVARGINASGHVVGYVTLAGGVTHAFRWAPNSPNGLTGTMYDIHPAGGYTSSLAYGINATGQIVGSFTNAVTRPFRTSGLGTVNAATDDLSGGVYFGTAMGINDSGVTVGAVNNTAFRSSGVIGVGDLIGTPPSSANAVNNTGVAVGKVAVLGQNQAAKAPAGNSMSSMSPGGVGVGSVSVSEAFGINASDVVVGAMSISDGGEVVGGTFRAFQTAAGANLNPNSDSIGTLGGPLSNSYAYGVNAAGTTVGLSEVTGGGTHGFIYEGEVLSDLNSKLDPTSSGWVVTAAYGINDKGQIVGAAMHPTTGATHAVLLSQPVTEFKVTSISPKQVLVGSGPFELTVFGSGFTIDSKVRWKDKTLLTTTFISEIELRAQVPGAFIAKRETPKVNVVKPGPVVSNTVRLRILPYLKGLKVFPSAIFGGNNTNGTVQFFFPAPTGGSLVTLGSENPAAAVPDADVTVPQGNLTGVFGVTTTPVAVDTRLRLTATHDGILRTGSMRVRAPFVLKVEASPPSVVGGTAGTGIVTLTGKAPTGGVVVTLNSLNTSLVTVPSTVTVLAGETQATFPITTADVAKKTTVQFTATSDSIRVRTGKIILLP